MYHTFYPAQVILSFFCFTHHPLDFCGFGQSICLTNGIYVLLGGNVYVEEHTTDTAVDFLIAFLVVAKAILQPTLDIIGREKYNSTFILQTVIDADEVTENRIR